MTASGLSPDELARRCSTAMWDDDATSQQLGMVIEHVAAGAATLSMSVTDKMTNGHGICHGGYIFTLADSAFAFACNGYNQRTVAQHCSITFIVPAQLGDRLSAIAIERSRNGRNGIYDIAVVREDGTKIAEFRGHSRTVKGNHLDLESADMEIEE